MDNELDTLRLEVTRLRDLLEEHGIDPDTEPPEPPQFGPPTALEAKSQALMAAYFETSNKWWLEDFAWLNGDAWEPGTKIYSALRIRLPNDFIVNRIKP